MVARLDRNCWRWIPKCFCCCLKQERRKKSIGTEIQTLELEMEDIKSTLGLGIDTLQNSIEHKDRYEAEYQKNWLDKYLSIVWVSKFRYLGYLSTVIALPSSDGYRDNG